MRRLVGFARSLAGAMGLLGLSLIFFFSCGPGFRNVSVKKVSIYFAAFFFLPSFLFFKYHPSIHNQISVSRVKTRI